MAQRPVDHDPRAGTPLQLIAEHYDNDMLVWLGMGPPDSAGSPCQCRITVHWSGICGLWGFGLPLEPPNLGTFVSY